MGAQESAARGKADVLEIGEEYSRKSGIYRIWSHVNPCTKNKRTKGTIFTKKFDAGSADEKKIFENGVKFLKQLRHPGVVTFAESSTEGTDQISLMTERVQVLDLCIDTLSFVEIHCGLRQVLETIIFLHEKARISHNNLSPTSIFVCASGEWKIGGFEFAGALDAPSEFLKSDTYKKARDPVFALNSEKTPTSRDSYAFGKLIEYVLENNTFCEDFDEEVIQALKAVAEGLTASQEAVSLPSLLENYAFSNDLTNITEFLSSVHLKGDGEKEEFFKDVETRLRSLPARVVSRRLCRLALSRYVILEPLAHTHLYPALLTPADEEDSGILPLDLYRSHLIPEVVRVFCVKEVSVRLGLLAHFDRYVGHIPREHLERFVLEEVLLSSRDVDDRLVAASLRAMADLVCLLGADRVCDWKLTKSFADSTAKACSRASSQTPASAPPPIEKTRKVRFNTNHLPPLAKEPAVTVASESFVLRPSASPPQLEELDTAHVEDQISYHQTADWDGDADWSDNWNTAEEEEDSGEKEEEQKVLEEAPKTVVQPLKLQSFVPAPKQTVKKENSIGSSLEIKAARTAEDDFFADMAPEIKTSGTLIDKLMKMKEEEERKALDAVLSSTTSKFAMAADAEVDSGADWGDDAWDEETEAPEEEDSTTEKGSAVAGAPPTNEALDDPSSITI